MTETRHKATKVLYQDRTLVVCVKPVGVESEREMPALLAGELGGEASHYFCVHRLDRTVGGVMVYARTARAAAALSAQMQNGTFKKDYLAVTGGLPAEPKGILQDLLYKDSAKGKAYPVKRARRGVKEASLEYLTLGTATSGTGPAALVWVRLHTGRFHQIRAQFASRKCPLLGDGKYGSREKECGVALFCARILFRHPTGGVWTEFRAAPPEVYPWNLFDVQRATHCGRETPLGPRVIPTADERLAWENAGPDC